jgi:hypothetical protein
MSPSLDEKGRSLAKKIQTQLEWWNGKNCLRKQKKTQEETPGRGSRDGKNKL